MSALVDEVAGTENEVDAAIASLARQGVGGGGRHKLASISKQGGRYLPRKSRRQGSVAHGNATMSRAALGIDPTE